VIKNYRDAYVGVGQFSLKVEPTDSRESDVEDQAGGRVMVSETSIFQQLGGRGKRLDLQTDRLQQAFDCLTQRSVIIHYKNKRIGFAIPFDRFCSHSFSDAPSHHLLNRLDANVALVNGTAGRSGGGHAVSRHRPSRVS
jgi:hypothetical protein